jgi:hypothetical protein
LQSAIGADGSLNLGTPLLMFGAALAVNASVAFELPMHVKRMQVD